MKVCCQLLPNLGFGTHPNAKEKNISTLAKRFISFYSAS